MKLSGKLRSGFVYFFHVDGAKSLNASRVEVLFLVYVIDCLLGHPKVRRKQFNFIHTYHREKLFNTNKWFT